MIVVTAVAVMGVEEDADAEDDVEEDEPQPQRREVSPLNFDAGFTRGAVCNDSDNDADDPRLMLLLLLLLLLLMTLRLTTCAAPAVVPSRNVAQPSDEEEEGETDEAQEICSDDSKTTEPDV